MENWTGIIKGTNHGFIALQIDYVEGNKIEGTFDLKDVNQINISAKIEGVREDNIITAQLTDFTPKAEGVPHEGTVNLTVSKDNTKIEGEWETSIGTKGECTLYKFSIPKKQPIDQQLPKPSTTLEIKDITIEYYSFDRKDIEELFKVMTSIASSIMEDEGKECLPPIYIITYDKEERIRTYSFDDFLNKLNSASKIWYVGYEFKNSIKQIQNILINISYQQKSIPDLRSNIYVESTNKKTTMFVPDIVRGFIDKFKNKNARWHHWRLEAIVQLSAVIIMTVFSFLISKKIAASFPSNLQSDGNYVLIIFIILLILSSNLWTYISRSIYNYINKTFPIVEIISKSENKRLSNLLFTIYAGIFTSATIYCLSLVYSFIKLLFKG